ncbi:hypothetical protein Phi4:1_gp078 [Cellulophaga phage phi4:1]|uniref:Transmembrane protein n=3 Tax=Lightbulbvirus Cba41 TaxID=1918524 RepID=A0A0S2MWP0_9CAUD|nr:hypothetical protein Phi4:1_gp078 [Cellulophaga phage phi4:1]AGO49491.1 hypothetical protein Phi4:1_gp078 [Cellulophaga phage phi4:1]ALO80087.1 hypothetical protein Phi4113_078 [Cellulophaga phage phi4:1_13]ALO80284.1 hypothetical protein Phi4118_078 [Cellulophaga phage phi4:1_18]
MIFGSGRVLSDCQGILIACLLLLWVLSIYILHLIIPRKYLDNTS